MRTGTGRATSAAVLAPDILSAEVEATRLRKNAITRVLVVEDSASDLMLLEVALRPVRGQLEILSADTLRAGIACADSEDADVMLLDLGLPDSDGLPTLQTAIREVPHVPVVVMTGRDDGQVAATALRLGAQDYLVKGRLDADSILRAVRYAIERHSILEKLRAADQLRQEYLATASHELRTPLTIIGDYAGLLRDGTAGPLLPAQATFLDTVLRNCARLSDLVNALLDVAKIESGTFTLRLEPTDLTAMMQNCVEDFRLRCESKQQKLVAEIPDRLPKGICDRGRVQEVILNFLGNANKFTPAGGAITVRAVEGRGLVRLEVEDTGIGISAEDQERIFNRFVQVGRKDAPGAQGTGLGLAIAKQIALMHGGTIGVESQPGRGSRFFFTFSTDSMVVLRAALSTRTGKEPGPTTLAWIAADLDGDRAQVEALCSVQQAANRVMRRADQAILLEDDRVLVFVLAGLPEGGIAFLRRLADEIDDADLPLRYAVRPLDEAAAAGPSAGLAPPGRSVFRALSLMRA
jgi:signal transduction histidine kinase